MRIAISNIAWDVSEDEIVANLLAKKGVDAIDIAPSKYFPAPESAEYEAILRLRAWWNDRGIEITGMQALLFGTTGLSLFAPPAVQEAMLLRLGAVCRIAQGAGATRLVFGSPKNRDRGHLTNAQASAVAIPFFRRLGEIAAARGVMICLEPNPTRYGCNFLTTTAETAEMVRVVDHPAIRLQIDTGSLVINGEDIAGAVRENLDIVGHVHASEPDLVPLGDGGTPHVQISREFRRSLPGHVVTVEMVATKEESHIESIQRALDVANDAYGDARRERTTA